MATKPIKFLELHYTMTQVLIITDIRDFITLFYVIFETQVLPMVRVVYRVT